MATRIELQVKGRKVVVSNGSGKYPTGYVLASYEDHKFHGHDKAKEFARMLDGEYTACGDYWFFYDFPVAPSE